MVSEWTAAACKGVVQGCKHLGDAAVAVGQQALADLQTLGVVLQRELCVAWGHAQPDVSR